MRFEKNLKYLLKENKITQSQLSAITGVNKKDLFPKRPSLPYLEKLSNLFMISSYDLSYGNVKKLNHNPILKAMPDEFKRDKQTMESVMQFSKIIINYKRINDLFIDSLIFEENPFNINNTNTKQSC